MAIRASLRLRALLACAWLLFGMLAASHHEASVAHATDRGGHSVHAPGLVGAHTSHDSDIHAAAPSPLDADCELVAHHAAHAAPSFALPAISIASSPTATATFTTTTHARELYLVAPKTSPPARA